MDIEFDNPKIQKLCDDTKHAVRRLNAGQAKLLRKRLGQIRAAPNLATLYSLGLGRCHQLQGLTTPTFTLDLDGPNRLVFNLPGDVPLLPDGGVNRSAVTVVQICKIEDTHGT